MNQLTPGGAFAAALAIRRPADCSDPTDFAPETLVARLLAQLKPVAAETLGLAAATGRILAGEVRSPAALPAFDQSAMDGFGLAVVDLDRPGAMLALGAARDPIEAGRAVRLYTGSPLPDGVVGILRTEHARVQGDSVAATRSIVAGADIRRKGEDVRPGDRLASPGAMVDARLVGLFAATGISHIAVRRKIRVAVLSTGDELLAGRRPAAVLDANGPMLRALLAAPFAEIADGGIHPDDPAGLAAGLRAAAATADLVVTSGGSAGSEVDVLVEAVRRAGGSASSHRLALKPGKPLVIGVIDGATLIGLPGNPFAAFISAQLFVRPAIAALAGRHFAPGHGTAALLAGPSRLPDRRREFLPAMIVGFATDGRPLVEPGKAGAARLAALATADGIVELAPHDTALEAGQPVAFHPAGTLWG